jgi:Predicted transcriptional regulators containing the CopG/Arc/MetJ DNA-binding domain and a metal-binding domain
MRRVTITIEDDLLAALDAFMARSGADNRSEAVREILRRGLAPEAPEQADCVGVMSYVVDPSVRDLGRRVAQGRQDRHDSAVAALSVPLGHDASVEVAVLRGPVGEVRGIAEGLFLERGVRHGRLALAPVRREVSIHEHGGRTSSHSHLHVLDRFEGGAAGER